LEAEADRKLSIPKFAGQLSGALHRSKGRERLGLGGELPRSYWTARCRLRPFRYLKLPVDYRPISRRQLPDCLTFFVAGSI
jgi:hypothetical protein